MLGILLCKQKKIKLLQVALILTVLLSVAGIIMMLQW